VPGGARDRYHRHPSVARRCPERLLPAVQNPRAPAYQAIIAATFVVFPLVSRSTFTEDRETTRR